MGRHEIDVDLRFHTCAAETPVLYVSVVDVLTMIDQAELELRSPSADEDQAGMRMAANVLAEIRATILQCVEQVAEGGSHA